MDKQPENDKNHQSGGGAGGIIFFVFYLLCMIGASILSWRANATEYISMRIIYTIYSFLSGPIYLVYYLIMRVLLGYELDLYRKIPTITTPVI